MTSLQWSRRLIGLKLFLGPGRERLGQGSPSASNHQARVADRLRDQLRDRGFAILNDKPPVHAGLLHPSGRPVKTPRPHTIWWPPGSG